MTFLSDGVVSLRPVERHDLEQLRIWRNDPELRARTREFRPLMEADQDRWFERISGPNRRDYMFVVVAGMPDESTSVRIGVAGLCYYDPISRKAEISFYRACGHESHARRALALLHEYGFNELNLHKIYAECYDFNEPAYNLLIDLGYVEEGRLKDHIWYDGWHDSIMMGLFK